MNRFSRLLLLIFFQICFGFQKKEIKTDSVHYYIEQKKPLKAVSYTHKRTKYLLENKEYDAYCDMMHRRAQLFEDLNDKENALKTLLTYSKIAEKLKLQKHIANSYVKIANLNITNLNFSTAKKYLYKSKKIINANDIDQSQKLYQAYYRLHNLSNSDSLEYYLKKYNQVVKNSKDPQHIFKSYNNSFSFYVVKKEYEKAKTFNLKAIQLAEKINDQNLITMAYTNYGMLLMEYEHNYLKAIEIYKKTLRNFKEGDNIRNKSNALLNISYAYEKLGDYKTAMDYNNQFLELQDEVFNGKIEQTTQEIETKYQIEKLEEEHKLKTQNIIDRQKRNLKIIYLLGALFILLIGIFYFIFQNLKLKQTNKLKDVDNELKNKIISATIDGQEQERLKISEVLHDNVSAILSSVGLHLSAFESSLNDQQIKDLQKTRSLLKQAHDKVRDLSHELVPPLLVKFGLTFALRDLCEKNSNSLIAFNFNSEIAKDKKFEHDFETKIYYIISELFNNTIKHSNASIVNLNLKLINHKLYIEVQDNGKGFEHKEITFGLGLTQIKARIKNMKGKFKIASEENVGTNIIIEVPLK